MENLQFVTVYLDDLCFGIDVLLIREVNRARDITPVALAPDFITGVLNLRGQIITVIDPGVRLGFKSREVSEKTRCVVLKSNEELANGILEATEDLKTSDDQVALLFDSMGDLVTVSKDEIEQPPANVGAVHRELIQGVVKRGDQLVIILKIDELLTFQEK
ncbi:MAG: chemotaxis protein CheW [Chitinispirillaceae bacterium]